MAHNDVVEIERRLQSMAYEIARLRDEITRLSQQLPLAWSSSPPSSGGGGGVCWAVSDAVTRSASGTWPSLTIPHFTSDVYQLSGSSLVLVGTAKTVNWPYKDPMSGIAGKLIPCEPNADGASYDAVEESCTKVT